MKKIYFCCLLLASLPLCAQTDIDGIMMTKNNFCVGLTYEHNSWDKYWEGTFQRENQNLGTVTTQKLAAMGNYGYSRKLNFLFNLNYIKTRASAGTLKGQDGLQDVSLAAKYMFLEKKIKEDIVALYAIGGVSAPVTDYTADYLPLSIGLQSKTASLRLMADIQKGDFFGTVSTAYIKRANIKIDRNTYYTTEMHYTNEVDMPDAISFNLRTGYRTNKFIAEVILDTWTTQAGGFDITSNNMPFPSNTMNMSRVGFNGKYYFPKMPSLSLIGGYNHVFDGRNVGQTNSFYAGAFYIINFNKAKKDDKI